MPATGSLSKAKATSKPNASDPTSHPRCLPLTLHTPRIRMIASGLYDAKRFGDHRTALNGPPHGALCDGLMYGRLDSVDKLKLLGQHMIAMGNPSAIIDVAMPHGQDLKPHTILHNRSRSTAYDKLPRPLNNGSLPVIFVGDSKDPKLAKFVKRQYMCLPAELESGTAITETRANNWVYCKATLDRERLQELESVQDQLGVRVVWVNPTDPAVQKHMRATDVIESDESRPGRQDELKGLGKTSPPPSEGSARQARSSDAMDVDGDEEDGNDLVVVETGTAILCDGPSQDSVDNLKRACDLGQMARDTFGEVVADTEFADDPSSLVDHAHTDLDLPHLEHDPELVDAGDSDDPELALHSANGRVVDRSASSNKSASLPTNVKQPSNNVYEAHVRIATDHGILFTVMFPIVSFLHLDEGAKYFVFGANLLNGLNLNHPRPSCL